MGLNICFVSPHIPPSFGGGGRRIYNIARFLAEQGHNINVITSTKKPSNSLQNLNIDTVDIPGWYKKKHSNQLFSLLLKIIWQPFIIYQLIKYISRNKSKVIHIVGSRSGISFYTVLIAKIMGINVVNGTSGYGNDDPITISKFNFGKLRKFVHFNLPDIILNNSPQLYKSCIDSKIKAEKVKMIPNPVNTETYAPLDSRNGAADIKKSLNIPEDKTIFINVSNITPSKNIEETIKLFSKYYNADKSAILLLVGKILDEEYYNDLKQILNKEKLDSSVRFTGRSNRVPELLKVSDCFIFTSKNEGMPNVVLEAMSSKLPIIIKRIPNVTDYMFQFDNGYVYRTEQEGVSYILNDFKDINKRTRIAKKARETALKVFSYPVIIDQYLNLYKSVQHSD